MKKSVLRLFLGVILVSMVCTPMLSAVNGGIVPETSPDAIIPPTTKAVITLPVGDTYWTTSQNNTDGYIVPDNANLFICANGSIGDIEIIYGEGGTGVTVAKLK